MYKVGITGGIGTGKSVACAVFAVLGIPVYDADSRAKWLTEHDPRIRKELTDWLGEEAFAGGTYNRAYIASTVFKDEAKTARLNAIIHPRVGTDFEDWISRQQAPYVLKEAALLYEAGSYKELDSMIVVAAPLEVRINRVLKRDPQRNREQVLQIIRRQWPDEQKQSMADHILYNDESSLLIAQILLLHESFLKRLLL